MTSMMPEILTALFALVIGFAWWVSWKGITFQKTTISELIEANKELSDKAIMVLKASTVEEAVQARAVEKVHDVQLEELRDTLAENAYDERQKEKESEPIYMKTIDGKTIDMRDFDPL